MKLQHLLFASIFSFYCSAAGAQTVMQYDLSGTWRFQLDPMGFGKTPGSELYQATTHYYAAYSNGRNRKRRMHNRVCCAAALLPTKATAHLYPILLFLSGGQCAPYQRSRQTNTGDDLHCQ